MVPHQQQERESQQDRCRKWQHRLNKQAWGRRSALRTGPFHPSSIASNAYQTRTGHTVQPKRDCGDGLNGLIGSGRVEESNVDMSQELVNMIIQQRNYQANAQSIKTQDQILQTLINLR